MTFDDVRKLAFAFPGMSEATVFGGPMHRGAGVKTSINF